MRCLSPSLSAHPRWASQACKSRSLAAQMVTGQAAPAGGRTACKRRWTGSWARCPAGPRLRAWRAGPAERVQLAARPACTACWASCTALRAVSCCAWVQPQGSTCPRKRQLFPACPSRGSMRCRRQQQPLARRPPPSSHLRRCQRSRRQRRQQRKWQGMRDGRARKACRKPPVRPTCHRWT